MNGTNLHKKKHINILNYQITVVCKNILKKGSPFSILFIIEMSKYKFIWTVITSLAWCKLSIKTCFLSLILSSRLK